MIRFSVVAAALCLLLASCAKQEKSTNPQAQDFALSLPLAVSGAEVRRLDLPPAELLALKRADKGDIRIFDANSRPLSIALLEPQAAQQDEIRLNAIPFAPRNEENASPPVSVNVDQGDYSVKVDAGGDKGNAADPAILIDARSVGDTATGIMLDVSLPKQRPVTVSIDAGTDLRTWHPLAEQVLFRPGDSADLLGGGRITFPNVTLRGQYLRISWHGAPEAKVAGATIFTTRAPLPSRIPILVTGLTMTDSHHLAFTTPSGLTPAAIRMTMSGQDGVVPLRLLGRDTSEAAWTPLAFAVLRQDRKSALLELGDNSMHSFRIEADSRGAGFSATPQLELQFAPVSLLAAFNGAGPYRLVVGNAEAKPAYFSPSELTGQRGPFATVNIVGTNRNVAVAVDGTKDASPAFAPRVVALWTMLFAGTALLAFSAVKLLRANKREG